MPELPDLEVYRAALENRTLGLRLDSFRLTSPFLLRSVEPLEADLPQFRSVLERERHTLKRTLTDPHLLAGIGNAYSDEILHRAQLSPFKLSDSLSAEESERLLQATRSAPLGMDPSPVRRGRRWLPQQGHGLPAGDGRAWSIRRSLSGV